MLNWGRLQIIGIGIALGAALLGFSLWRAVETGRTIEQAQAAKENLYVIRKAYKARERAHFRESDRRRMPDDQWRRD